LDLEKIAMISVSLDSANCLIWFLVSPCLPLRDNAHMKTVLA